MVKLEEVVDEELIQGQSGPIGGEDDWDTDTDSDGSDVDSIASDDDISSETLYDRLIALQDMLPPTQRRFISSTASTTTSWVKSGLAFSGKALWIVSTSLLLLGVPWALAYAEEQQMIEMEKEMQMQQQASNLLTQPSNQDGGNARPAL
ncbi:uncharacterized protein PV09_05244 [Verruconis gallopava]|uniref:Mitochondrial import receptor subunit tom22 n=1 Tax=Verruconis gallopava TaxID=253628 RepID=A0A0D1YS82_9PEZI|nr:uncharacterized protein PV09_05244 [Verruconis gallopava]KIW03477.1 hypothetical protein PV09_05244 [Verruconis gallopava]